MSLPPVGSQRNVSFPADTSETVAPEKQPTTEYSELAKKLTDTTEKAIVVTEKAVGILGALKTLMSPPK